MKNLIRTSLVAALTIGMIGLGLGAPAHAGNIKAGHKTNFARIDANSGAKVTPAEMVAHRNARFAAEDRNSDGFLSKEEITAAALKRFKKSFAKRLGQMFKQYDRNGDGKISLAEFDVSPRVAKIFSCLDRDGGGSISAAELTAAIKLARHGACRK